MRFFSSIGLNLIELAVKEAESLGLHDIRNERGSLSFEGDFWDAVRYCLYSRISARLMLQLAKTDEDLDADSLKEWIKQYPFENFFGPDKTIAVTNTIIKSRHITNNMLCSQVVKDGICDRQREKFGIRSSVDRDDPDFTIHVFLTQDHAALYLDFSGQSLSKRHYRVVNTPVYLQEHTAYAVFNRSCIKDEMKMIVDPFVGSGTILIEAALFYTRTAPGLIDPERFAFLRYREFDRIEYDELLEKAQAEKDEGVAEMRKAFGGKPFLFGFDCDQDMLDAATANAEKAGMLEFIRFERKRIQDLDQDSLPEGDFLVITDPPYSIREEIDDIKGLYIDLNKFITEQCKGRNVSILTPASENLSYINLRPWKTNAIMNGQIKCALNGYYVLTDERKREIEEKKREDFERRMNEPLNEGATSFYNRLMKNRKVLSGFLEKNGITCYRLYDADMREYSASLDVYEDRAVLCEYEKGRFIDEEDAQTRLEDMKMATLRALRIPYENLYVKSRKRMRGKEQYEKKEKDAEIFIVRESGLRFLVNFTNYLDTYLFLDHRSVRSYIRERSSGKRFLNLFCYTGTASVNAKKGGAISTQSVDANQNYLDVAKENFRINNMSDMSDFFIRSDVFTFLKSLYDNDVYDFIYLDPPTFSNGKDKRDFDLQKDHEKLIRLCMKHLDKSGELLFSCNFRSFEMSEKIIGMYDVEDITQSTIDEDFANSGNIHKAYSIKHRKEREERDISQIAMEILGC